MKQLDHLDAPYEVVAEYLVVSGIKLGNRGRLVEQAHLFPKPLLTRCEGTLHQREPRR